MICVAVNSLSEISPETHMVSSGWRWAIILVLKVLKASGNFMSLLHRVSAIQLRTGIDRLFSLLPSFP